MVLSCRQASRCRGIVRALFLLIPLSALVGASPASATTYTWTGSAPVADPDWSRGANWGGVELPEEPSIRLVEEEGELFEKNLVFPELGACDSATEACANSHNDRSGQYVHSLSFGCGSYGISGDPITLGPGGLAMLCKSPNRVDIDIDGFAPTALNHGY